MKRKILSKKLFPIIAAVILAAMIAAPVLASPATAIRMLPASVTSGVEFDIAIEASGCGAFGQVMETLPDGFTYISCTPDDIGVEPVGNTVKFTFLGSASFTYRVKAPTIATTTTCTFHGVVKDADLNEFAVIGDTTITVTTLGPVTYTLTMAVNGNGSTTPPAGSHTYEAGTIVVISATPASGWRFDHWPSNVANPSSSSTTVTMNSNKTVTAYFAGVSGARTVPASVPSEAEFNVAIKASGCGIWGQVIETLPSGFTYVSSSLPADQVEQVGNTVKFTFLDSTSFTFTYKVKAPRVADTTTYTFQGRVLDEDRISYPIEDDEITVTVETPATAPPIGGKGYFPSMLGLLIPWIALGVVLMGSITWFVLRRRKA